MNEGRERVLGLLKKELAFLESGGYKLLPRSPWRAAYIFEDSPSCPNFSDRARPQLCENCWLMEFVSPEFRDEQVPCRFVQLNASGITVDSLYRHGTPAETEEELRQWLQNNIRQLEADLIQARAVSLSILAGTTGRTPDHSLL